MIGYFASYNSQLQVALGVSVFTGLDYWTGLLDWTTGLENHTPNERILTTPTQNLGKITSYFDKIIILGSAVRSILLKLGESWTI